MPLYPVPTSVVERASVLSACGLEIPAALTLPERIPPRSLVLLIPGSLFADVNGDYPAWNAFPGANVSLAQQLATRGHAVFRFAKSGPGTGTVVADAGLWARHQTWDGRLAIAEAAFAAMSAALAAAGFSTELKRIVAGHSEGAVVALRLGQRVETDGVVSLAGPATGILSIMREQALRMHSPEKLGIVLPALDRAIAAIREGRPIPDDVRAVEGVGGLATMPPDGHGYMRDCDATDPTAEAARLKVPLLVVQGTDDWNVPVHHGRALSAAPQAGATLVLVEGASHFFKLVPAGTDPMAAFGWPGPCDPRVADAIASWIGRL